MSDDTSIPPLAELRKKLTELRVQAASVEAEIETLEAINQLPLQVEEHLRGLDTLGVYAITAIP